MSKCLLIDNCDFEAYPVGGQLSFAKQIISCFGDELALVGITRGNDPVGEWTTKRIGGVDLPFFSIGCRPAKTTRPFIPHRLSALLQFELYRKSILSLGVRNAFVQAPEFMIPIATWGMEQIAYIFHGIENPLRMPRYRWGELLAKPFDLMLFRALNKARTTLACADNSAIERLAARSCGTLDPDKIIKFPTRVDTDLFKPTMDLSVRSKLGLDRFSQIIASCGRLNRVKGWDFVLESFRVIAAERAHIGLVFIGDGEDRAALEREVYRHGLSNQVVVTGFVPPAMVVEYFNASDLAIVGSHMEGWSVAILEALACGRPVVSTEVSGARDLIRDGKNGYVVPGRNPIAFAEAMYAGLSLPSPNLCSLGMVEPYAMKSLKKDLQGHCPFLN
jgi:glycosyltransferase involved in cell wall biosynthesis